LAAGTINQRLAAVRRLAYEAADSGLLSPELAAGIRRVKGVKQLGSRVGNWLTRDQARLLLETADGESLRSTRDLAMISILLGCGLRRAELASLSKNDTQVRHGHWAIVDLVGKGGHVRTVPMPIWVKSAVDRWMTAAAVTDGRIFRAVSRHGTSWAKASLRMWSGMWFADVLKEWNWITSRLTISGGHVRNSVTSTAASWSRFSSFLVTSQF
jgi:site-specific recombinase XerC